MASSDNLTLAGRRAVVTGASRGIGRSIALALAQAGANVAVSARTNAELQSLVAQIQSMGRQSLAVLCDVTDSEQVQHMAKTLIAGLGGVDILVNNAGNAGSHKFLNHPDELWQRMLSVNLTSVYYVTTPMTDAQVSNIATRTGMSEARAREVLETASPQRRLMEPEEVAAIAVFLAQDLSRGITGQAINIDGGGVMS